MNKLVFTQKQIILTNKRLSEHLFAGQNTQQMYIADKTRCDVN